MNHLRKEWNRLKDAWDANRWAGNHGNPSRFIIIAGTFCLFAYILFAILPLFIPGADFSHFPPYLALPDGGFNMSNYYFLYFLISFNALMLFGLYFISLKSVSGYQAAPADLAPPRRFRPWRRNRETNYIFSFAALFHLVMLLTPFLLSTDLFDYIRHGRIFAIYGENPLVVPATYFPHDPFFNLGGWLSTGAVYGPLHVYVTGLLAWLAGNGIGANFLVFKAFFLGLNLLNVVLIGSITARLHPGLEKKAMLFYGWNPFILALVVANAHNDILMLTFVLLGIACFLKRRFVAGALLITLATLVKFMALPILLVYFALALRKLKSFRARLLSGAGMLAVSAGAVVISYWRLWEGMDTFRYLTDVGQKTNFTIPGLMRDIAAGHLRLSLSNTVVQLTVAILLLAYILWHTFGVKNTASLLSAAAGIAFLTPLALFWFQPWYLTMAMGLIALRPWRLIYKVSLVFSFTVMFFDSFWWHTPMSMDVEKSLRVLVVFGPPIALLLWAKGREILPAAWRRIWSWSLESDAKRDGTLAATDPALVKIVAQVAGLFAAALVPMALIVSISPHLRELTNLVFMKFQLLTHL